MRLVALAAAFRPEPVARATPDAPAVAPRNGWAVDAHAEATATAQAPPHARIGLVEAHGVPAAEVPLAGFVELAEHSHEALPQNPLRLDKPAKVLYGGGESLDTKIILGVFTTFTMTVLVISYLMQEDADDAIEDGMGIATLSEGKMSIAAEARREARHEEKKQVKLCRKLLEKGTMYAEIAERTGLSEQKIAQIAVRMARKENVAIKTDEEITRAKAFVWRKKLVKFYETHNPEKVEMVDKILHQFAGREDELFHSLAEKYGTVNPLEEESSDSAAYDISSDEGAPPGSDVGAPSRGSEAGAPASARSARSARSAAADDEREPLPPPA